MKPGLVSARSTVIGIALVAVALVWALKDLALLVGYAVLLAGIGELSPAHAIAPADASAGPVDHAA